MKNRRRLTGKETLFLGVLYGVAFGILSVTLGWEDLWNSLIFLFGIGLPALLVFSYFYGVKIDKEKL